LGGLSGRLPLGCDPNLGNGGNDGNVDFGAGGAGDWGEGKEAGVHEGAACDQVLDQVVEKGLGGPGTHGDAAGTKGAAVVGEGGEAFGSGTKGAGGDSGDGKALGGATAGGGEGGDGEAEAGAYVRELGTGEIGMIGGDALGGAVAGGSAPALGIAVGICGAARAEALSAASR